jgi:glycosyltransferase A (GT-A) superfamily protein (DUF2064 family)
MVAADADVGRDLTRIHADKHVIVADNLGDAVQIASQQISSDMGIVFDGCYGSINLTRPMAEHLLAMAPEVSRRVDEELLPKWLRQRNLSLS